MGSPVSFFLLNSGGWGEFFSPAFSFYLKPLFCYFFWGKIFFRPLPNPYPVYVSEHRKKLMFS
jgi:hypothetical protein